jgi:hypothetical protein
MEWLAEQVLEIHKKGKRSLSHKDIYAAMIDFHNVYVEYLASKDVPESVLEIFDAAGEVTGYLRENIISNTRKRSVVYTRNIIIKLISELGFKDATIARFVHRDRTLVIGVLKDFDTWINFDDNRKTYQLIKKKIAGRLQ